MERERGMVQQPPAKRVRMTAVSVGGGEAASPRDRKLRHTLLVLRFLVRVRVTTDTVTASISQISGMIQRHVDRALHKYHVMISRQFEGLRHEVIEGLRHEVGRLARTCPNCNAGQHTRLEPNQEHVAADGSNTNIQLRFLNDWKPPIFTDKDITDENNAAIKVAVFGGDKIIKYGPLSKAKIEILVLRGGFYNKCRDNWTEEEFDKHIVPGRDEQGLVLGTAWLTNGEVELSQIRFKEGSCRKKFSMAARVCKNQNTAGRVREAIMKPEKVKDRRNEPNEKSNPPRLNDEVYRLEMIAKDRIYHKRLLEANIRTVRDFLKALNKDCVGLRKILKLDNKNNSWSKLIGHARKCVLEDSQELKRYQSEEGNVVLFFNCIHDLVGAAFPGDYVASEGFDPSQKALVNKWKAHAHEKLEDIPFDYVMKGNIPEPISSSTDVAAAPSVLAVGASQSKFSAGHLAAYQGTGATENLPHDVYVVEPVYPIANCGPTIPDDLTTYYYQGIPPLGQQQMIWPSIELDWQQNSQGLMDSPELFEIASMIEQPSGASTSAQLNLEPPHHLPQQH